MLYPEKIYSFNDAWCAWLTGEKFPIAFYGDSTIHGMGTSGVLPAVLGEDNLSANAFPKKLEKILKESTSNEILRIYNAGFAGQDSAWGLHNLKTEFGLSSAYHDTKMVGIGFGINDRIAEYVKNELDLRKRFKENIEKMIHLFYDLGIQPFLLTTQATIEPGTNNREKYPYRTSMHVETIVNEVKRELAVKYSLSCIDLNKYTEKFIQYSKRSLTEIIEDGLHFSDLGHQYEAELIARYFNPQIITVKNFNQIDITSQKVISNLSSDRVIYSQDIDNHFKAKIYYRKADVKNKKMMTFWLFNEGKEALTLEAYKSNIQSETYLKWNKKRIDLNHLKNTMAVLDLGLHKLEVYTGSSEIVDFKGFIVRKKK